MPPVLYLRDHLMWTRSGVIWATWRLTGLPYGYAGPETKRLTRAAHRALFRALRGEALLLSLSTPESAERTADRMMRSDVRFGAAWRREVDLVRADLEARPAHERTHWLSVPLAQTDVLARLRSLGTVMAAELRDALALPRHLPSLAEIEAAQAAASRVEALIPSSFGAVPAGSDEVAWVSERCSRRGLEHGAHDVRPVGGPPTGRFVTRTALPDALLDEGAVTDLPSGGALRNPFVRRFLKVHGTTSETPSYQVLLALMSGPKSGWAVPGGEWLAALDRVEEPLDWAMRMSISAGGEVRRRNRSAELSLRDQVDQQDADSDELGLGAGAQLGDVATSLRDYAVALGRADDEVEVQTTVMLAIGADTGEEALRRADLVRRRFRDAEFRFEAPFGGQQQLWWAMQPGVPTGALSRDLAQFTTGHELATAVPLVSSDLGDDTGLLLGQSLTTGRRAPVFLDPEATIQSDRSASIGIVAELGAGKSYTLKKIAGDCVDRGARVIVIDRTEAREYATFATSLLPGETAVVDLADPACSLDPLRLFGPAHGARYVQSLFATLLGVRPRDEIGVELARLLDPARARSVGLDSLAALRRQLATGRSGEVGRRMLGLIDLIAGTDLGRVLFDGSLPPLDLRARAIIPLTAGLELPTAQELDRQHLFDQLPLEKLFGRAMYAFLTGLARQIAFTSRDLTLFCADECHHITTSPEGQSYILDFLRDGRKHNALAVLASHDPYDFGDVRARGLIPVRMVMRHTDPVLAERALEWLERGLERDEALARELREDTSPAGPDGNVPPDRRGEALLRDARQRIGKIRVLPPQRPERRATLHSTPTRTTLAPVRSAAPERGTGAARNTAAGRR